MSVICFHNELHEKIYEALKNTTYKTRITASVIKASLGIDNRMLAAHVRTMNDMYEGQFFIGSDKKGYWLTRSSEERVAAYLAYNQTILSSLHERKKIKRQITAMDGDINLFGERVNTNYAVR
jgi:hypothetical protein